jgi:hypothetical protein
MRNNFTTIFGGVGVRRVVIQTKKCLITRRSKMQMVRRAHQGWRNKTFGSLHALKIRLKYGRRKPAKWYRI